MNQFKRTTMESLLSISLVLCPTLAGCDLFAGNTLSGGPVKGVVIDQQTQQPIQGAVVVSTWYGSRGGPVQSSTTWYHVETTITNERGAYEINSWTTNNVDEAMRGLRNKHVETWAYAPGYEVAPDIVGRPDALVLARFAGTREQRLDYLVRKATVQGGEYDNSAKNLITLRLAVSKEAHAIAQTDEDRQKAQLIEWKLNALCRIPSGQRIGGDTGAASPYADLTWPPPPCTDAQLRKG